MNGGGRTTFRTLAVLTVAALLIMLPEWVAGPTLSHSIRYNIVWTEQFRDLVREGIIYPRWLPRSWDGLGSPTFYFYPPLWFWIAALIDAATLHLLSLGALITAATAASLAASGTTMWLWLRGQGVQKPALFAVVYIAAPYHLYDIYVRGALAEALAYAMLPLSAFALHRLAYGRRGGIALLALSCAALLLTHLPTAFLTVGLLLVPYCLFLTRTADQGAMFLAKAAVAGCLGIGIAAIYWLPIIWLTSAISLDAFTGPFFTPSSWFFWAPWRWLDPISMRVVIPLAIVSALMAMLVLIRRGQGRVWAGLALVAVAMAGGLVPFLWNLPGFSYVQFPYRCLVVVEFATLTAVALAFPENIMVRRAAVALAVFLASFVLPNALLHISSPRPDAAVQIGAIRAKIRDAPEFLPKGFPIPIDEQKIPDPSRVRFPDIRFPDVDGNGPADISVVTQVPGLLVLRRFYYPFWRVADADGRRIPIFAFGPHRLLAWSVQPGRHRFRLVPGPARGEREGAWITAVSLLAAFATVVRRQRR